MTPRIFVQIASYRDPELQPTIADCVARAADPGRLVFGICWQRAQSEQLGDYARDRRFRIHEVDYRRSRGTCWARHQVQGMYDGEEYTLHLDSHHRFTEGWDETCIDMLRALQRTGVRKPILTSYAPHYDPQRDPDGRGGVPWQMRFRRFSTEGVVEAIPEAIPDHGSLSAPIPARLFSAHFAFALGRFCVEVPHDPKLYFFGEEPTLAVRAFTHGYDLFHPHRLVLWHQYGRPSLPKHWGDHERWAFHDARSHQRVRQLLRTDDAPCEIEFGPYGLGRERSLRDWAQYSGIHYGLRGVSDRALHNLPPPEPKDGATEAQWRERFVREQRVRVEVTPQEVAPGIDDFDFWYFGAHTIDGRELFRRDLSGAELGAFLAKSPHTVELVFHSAPFADSWTAWPHSASRGWLQKVTRPIARGGSVSRAEACGTSSGSNPESSGA